MSNKIARFHALALKTAQEWWGHDGPSPSLVYAIEAACTVATAEAEAKLAECKKQCSMLERSMYEERSK